MTGLPADLNELPELGIAFRVEVRDGRKIYIPVMPATCAYWVPDDQVTARVDKDGRGWMLEKATDGRWWKRRTC